MVKDILEMRDITVEFPSVKALDHVNFTVREGEVHAVAGENGAGKSTLMKVLSGVYGTSDYTGELYFDGEKREFSRINDSERAGIAIIFQELNLVSTMSIVENIFLGNEIRRAGIIDRHAQYTRAVELLKRVRLDADPNDLVGRLGSGKQQLVEIARALNKQARLLILDEPTASLTKVDSENLLALLRELQADGITCIYISHKLDELFDIANRITILRDGRTVMTEEMTAMDENAVIVQMVGRELTDRYPARAATADTTKTALEVRDWNVPHPQQPERMLVSDANLSVHPGEIVGIAGLIGAGRTELALSIFGALRVGSGTLLVDGVETRIASPEKAIGAGIAYVSEDRKDFGLVLIRDIRDNMTLASLDRLSRFGVIDTHRETYEVQEKIRELRVKTPSMLQKVKNLSGGNQQKVILGKWLLTSPKVLILDEPTRGIDVGAKWEIYQIMNDLAAQGVAIIMISSEMPEILGMSDRVYVMGGGRIRAEFDRAEDITQEKILYYAQGGA